MLDTARHEISGRQPGTGDSPFRLENRAAFERWRARKLHNYPVDPAELCVPLADPCALTDADRERLRALCERTNMAVYRTPSGVPQDKSIPRLLGRQLGLNRLDPNMLADDDGITTLSVVEGKSQRGYIPYSNRRLLWHTDGYYNPPQRRIRAMLLHCASPAQTGGENALLDHEIVYLFMREENPEFVRALMAEDAMTIPANDEADGGTRAAQSGPVFSVDPASGDLHMRYTARTRSIVWKDDATTRGAVRWLEDFLGGGAGEYIVRWCLQEGEGIVCNNVLHNRTGFEDGERRRVVYRARYHDRIDGTSVANGR